MTEKSRKHELPSDIQVARIENQTQLQEAFASGLAEVYAAVFKEEPYCEIFEAAQVQEIFRKYQQDGDIFIATKKDRVIGFGVMIPLSKSSIADYVYDSPGYIARDAQYMADLGVIRQERRQGVALSLVRARLDLLYPAQQVYIRTSIAPNNPSKTLWNSLGATDTGLRQDVLMNRIDGTQTYDTRMILKKVK